MRLCSIDGCDRKHSSNGYCNMHAMRHYRLGSALAAMITYPEKCTVEGCENKYKCSGFCNKHFQRMNKHGTTKADFHDISTIERFVQKIKINEKTNCHEWIGSKLPKGYGQFTAGNKSYRSHRFSYQYYKGNFPQDLFVLHRCDNPSCVNPDHLFLGTNDDNMKDMVSKERSVHRYGEQNPSAKINESKAIEIKNMIDSGKKYKDIASELDVSIHIVSNIARCDSWSYLFKTKEDIL